MRRDWLTAAGAFTVGCGLTFTLYAHSDMHRFYRSGYAMHQAREDYYNGLAASIIEEGRPPHKKEKRHGNTGGN